jgi:alpha-galactosidase
VSRRLSRTVLFVAVGLLGVGAAVMQVARLGSQAGDDLVSVTHTSLGHAVLSNSRARFTLTPHGNVGVRLAVGKRWLSLQLPSDPVGRVSWDGVEMADASLTEVDEAARIVGPGWPGRSLRLRGSVQRGAHRWTRWVDVHLGTRPGTLLAIRLGYRNEGARPATLDSITTLQATLAPERGGRGARHETAPLWTFHGVSERNGQPAVEPSLPGLDRPNIIGVIDKTGRGGGLPIVAAWSSKVGYALGHLDPKGHPVALPVRRGHAVGTHVAVHLPGRALRPGESLETPWLFVAAFEGDYYDALRLYADTLRLRGWRPAEPSPAAYAPTWCGWGFGRNATPDEMIGVIPALKRLGLRWATVDEGWFRAIGDWTPRGQTYGEDGIGRVVQAYHAAGLKAQLWWLPIGAGAGETLPGLPRRMSNVVQEHPEWLIRNAAGEPALMVHGLAALCPALPEVRAYHRDLVRQFLGQWDFDGLKLDYVFTVPECHDPRHGHVSPHDSVDAMAELMREIRDEAKAIKPDCVIQICPCGMLPNIAWLAFEDQPVTSDPSDGAQVRRRIKIYKALLGDRTPVYGDHVELTGTTYEGGRLVASGSDFASTVGPGGVPGTRFVWPEARPRDPQLLLTPQREAHWRHWLDIYRSKDLAEGQFRNLYTYGFDWPEAYAVARAGRMYYAFFAGASRGDWEGTLELRGLGAGRYRVRDYEHERDLGVVTGPVGQLETTFVEHLLVEAIPEG